jgi:ATP-binding cassette subfamily C protein LapB
MKIRYPAPKNDLLKPEGFSCYPISLLLSTLAISILSLALPVMTLQVYDRILPNRGSGTLTVLIIGVCVAAILEMIVRLGRSFMIGRSGAAYEHRMSVKAFSSILNADLSMLQTQGIGERLQHISSIGKLKEFYNGNMLTTIIELAFVPLALLITYYIAGLIALVPSLILAAFTLLSIRNGKKLRSTLQKREATDDERFNFLVETLESVHTVKALALEPYFERRYEALEKSSVHANYAVTQHTAYTFNSGAIFSHIMVASVITVGAWAVLAGYITTGSLIATLLLSGRMMQPVQKALALWVRYQDYQLARSHALDLMNTPQKILQPRSHSELILQEGRLEINDISFHYQGNATPILHRCSLSLPTKCTMLLSGAHGSGKTTLMKLIAGIYSTNSGEILIDGERVNTYSSVELASHVGYIRAKPVIFRGTIRDNITAFGQIPESQARSVAAIMGLDRDIAMLPSGFDTFLHGNDTDNIPLGFKQRISIVRTLATKPKLILFDNADRALDREGYETMHRFLARLKGKATIILISDDKNIRSLADAHYVLQDGRLVSSDDVAQDSSLRPYRELLL